MADAARAHSLLISESGGLHPVLLNGYVADPGLPLRFVAAQTDEELVPAGRADWAAADASLAQVAVYSGAWRRQWFNPLGSMVAAELGAALVPLYGPVWLCRPADAAGVISKLSVPVKELVAFKLAAVRAVLSGVRPAHLDEQAYLVLWARMRTLLEIHHAAAGSAGGPAPIDPFSRYGEGCVDQSL